MPRKPPQPSDAQLLRESDEAGRIQRAAPDGKELARSLGAFKTCDTPTLLENERGEFQVNVTDERATPHENRHRIGMMNDAMEERRALQTERTLRKAAEDNRIAVRDERDGSVREIPAEMEDVIARKKWARPGARKRSYFFMGG